MICRVKTEVTGRIPRAEIVKQCFAVRDVVCFLVGLCGSFTRIGSGFLRSRSKAGVYKSYCNRSYIVQAFVIKKHLCSTLEIRVSLPVRGILNIYFKVIPAGLFKVKLSLINRTVFPFVLTVGADGESYALGILFINGIIRIGNIHINFKEFAFA